MTRARPMTSSERRALADALRHMRSAGVGRADRMAIAGRSDKKLAYSIPVSRGQA